MILVALFAEKGTIADRGRPWIDAEYASARYNMPLLIWRRMLSYC
jgi:hypothetical protein